MKIKEEAPLIVKQKRFLENLIEGNLEKVREFHEAAELAGPGTLRDHFCAAAKGEPTLVVTTLVVSALRSARTFSP